MRICRELGLLSRDELYQTIPPAERVEWLLYFREEPTLAELLDIHFAQLTCLLASVNAKGNHRFSPDDFRLIKPPKEPKTTEDVAAVLRQWTKPS